MWWMALPTASSRAVQPHTIVLPFRDGPDLTYLGPVIEENGGDKSLARLLFLLFYHGVEAADGVPLQPLHGAAAVQDEHQFRQILLQKSPLMLCCLVYKHSIGGF